MATNAGKYAAITKIFVYRVGWVVESKAGCGSVEFVDWYVSHAGTVLPGCFKGDSESQCNSMEKGKIWPPTVPWTPKPMATKFCMGNEVGDPYPCAKFHYYPIRGFRSPPPPLPCSVGNVQSDSASYFFRGSSSSLHYSQDPCTDFHDQYVKWRRFAQLCASWGQEKQNFTFRPHFPQKRKLLANFRRDLENFASKRP